MDAPPHLRHGERDGLDETVLRVEVVGVLAIDPELPWHHKGGAVVRELVVAGLLRPLLQDGGAVFQRLEHPLSEQRVGVGVRPGPGDVPGRDATAFLNGGGVFVLEIDLEPQVCWGKQVARGAVEFGEAQVQQRPPAVVLAGLDEGVDRPVVGRSPARGRPALLDQFQRPR